LWDGSFVSRGKTRPQTQTTQTAQKIRSLYPVISNEGRNPSLILRMLEAQKDFSLRSK
jgi:hypothetical protein